MYAKGRSNGTIPDEFCAFLTDNIDKVKDQRDFEAFALYFEAVVGYMYGKGLVK
jgi:CRISPR/Cas system CSM-associated protein Csm2 small subunit